jgi:haloalkane dehalogenase
VKFSSPLYPFASHWFDRGDGIRMHYVDEGQGDPVVMVHGNPSWSFYYRELIKTLSPSHRAIAMDHVGMGLSDKPGDDRYTYTLKSRIDDLDALLESAKVERDVTLVLHDWGGAIGMGWAIRHPERIKRIVLLNTAAFHMPSSKTLPKALWLARDTKLGAVLVEKFNAFARGAVSMAMTRRKMSPEVRAGFLAPYEPAGDRIATLRFVQDIPLSPSDRAYPVISEIQEKVAQFADRPTLICWGEKDFVFDRHFLAEWKRLYPKAQVSSFPSAGHYVLEDASDLVLPQISEFLRANPIGAAA